MHSTNYHNAFILTASDTPATAGTVPPSRATPSVAERTFSMIHDNPYAHTSDEVIFTVFADRKGLTAEERPAAREAFFSKGQPCMRASDLPKRYGWGVHFDAAGRMALVDMGSKQYQELAARADEPGFTVTSAMRAKR